jgi:hypothetical protein
MSTRRKRERQAADNQQIHQHELESLSQQINVAIIKGLRSVTRRVTCSAKINISNELFLYLSNEYGFKFTLQQNERFLDDFRIIRANFINKTDYSKVECLGFAIRKSREVIYKSFKDGRLESKYLSPLPYLTIGFLRNDKKMRF